MMKPTPTPWEFESDSLVLCLEAKGYVVMTASGNPNAEYIKRNTEANANIVFVHKAVNNHAALVEALKLALPYVIAMGKCIMPADLVDAERDNQTVSSKIAAVLAQV